jgi:NDP-sugar pyrophosphorylase family protein
MNRKKFITSTKSISTLIPKDKRTEKTETLVTFILLCDMPGYRMKSYGSTSLINIKDKKLIDFQIEAINQSFKKNEIIICTGFDAHNLCKYIKNKYSQYNIRIVENQLFNTCNSCESLRLCLNNINNSKIFVIDGSLFFTTDIFNTVDLNRDFLLIEDKPSENLEIGVNVNEINIIEHFSYGAQRIWSEIIYFTKKEVLDSLRRLLYNEEYKNKLIFELFNDLLKLNHEICYIKNKHAIQKLNNIKIYKNLKDHL